MGNRSKASLVTHPIRARVILTSLGRELTVQEMADALPDIPKTSLYRHVRELAEAGVLKVVGERAIRGTVEKTYSLEHSAIAFSKEDLLDAGHEEYLRLVSGMLNGIRELYQTYLARREPTLAEDTLFRTNAAYLSDEEFWEFREKLKDLLASVLSNPMTPERRRRFVSLIAVPDEAPTPDRGLGEEAGK